ncbi:hypothetical protein PMAYCL1PPCAC_28664, partial [Pristionchus mayeri]
KKFTRKHPRLSFIQQNQLVLSGMEEPIEGRGIETTPGNGKEIEKERARMKKGVDKRNRGTGDLDEEIKSIASTEISAVDQQLIDYELDMMNEELSRQSKCVDRMDGVREYEEANLDDIYRESDENLVVDDNEEESLLSSFEIVDSLVDSDDKKNPPCSIEDEDDCSKTNNGCMVASLLSSLAETLSAVACLPSLDAESMTPSLLHLSGVSLTLDGVSQALWMAVTEQWAIERARIEGEQTLPIPPTH